MTTQTHSPDDPSSDKPIERRSRWENSTVPERRCTAHKRNGDRCGNPAIHGGTVCGYHGGNAPAVKAKARLRLEMASDRLARELLNMTTDPNVADPVKLAAIKDALDRSGLAAKNAVSVEVGISKPFERVFDSIMAGPRDPENPAALAIENANSAIESGDDAEILGEFDDPPPDDEISDYPPGTQQQRESESVIDVEIVADEYTVAGPLTPDNDDSSASGDLGAAPYPYPDPLGPTGPAGSGPFPTVFRLFRHLNRPSRRCSSLL